MKVSDKLFNITGYDAFGYIASHTTKSVDVSTGETSTDVLAIECFE